MILLCNFYIFKERINYNSALFIWSRFNCDFSQSNFEGSHNNFGCLISSFKRFNKFFEFIVYLCLSRYNTFKLISVSIISSGEIDVLLLISLIFTFSLFNSFIQHNILYFQYPLNEGEPKSDIGFSGDPIFFSLIDISYDNDINNFPYD